MRSVASTAALWAEALGSETGGVAVAAYLASIDTIAVAELEALPGIGPARAARVAAILELLRRDWIRHEGRAPIRDASDVFELLRHRLCGLRQERFFSVALNTRHDVLGIFEIARGAVDYVNVHPREAYRPLIREAAAAVIFVHNHPSGDPEPSQCDAGLNRRLQRAGELLSIRVVDHIIVGSRGFVSLAERDEIWL